MQLYEYYPFVQTKAYERLLLDCLPSKATLLPIEHLMLRSRQYTTPRDITPSKLYLQEYLHKNCPSKNPSDSANGCVDGRAVHAHFLILRSTLSDDNGARRSIV